MTVDPSRAKSLFLNASDLADPAECAAYLGRECGEDAELRDRVEALLRAHERAPLPPPASEVATIDSASGGPAMEATSVHTPNPDAGPSPISITAEYRGNPAPDVLIAGRYTLQEKIGEGGMGEVWVAKQSEPVKRKVALKLIKPGMDSRAVLQRFEQERQALAMMDHPNIAKVLDAGLTPDGRPFFVMELVNGLPLNKFCDEVRLATRDRLQLFVTICQAVQHAHQKGIVHRDLKPANILITIIDGKPVPKVIDFGVAKATAGKLTDESMSTQFGAIVGTLEYMSPEQAGFSGEDIDTRADIYSLGVILYEMLTGLRPIDARRLKKAALTEMIRVIREEEPSKPSTRLSTDASLPSMASLRQTEPRKLMALLRGELDWVVMKCLEKHRERRYETANALARDIQRYLADETVEARPPSAGYRLGKFLHRNKGPVLAASLILLAVLGGLTAVVAVEARANASLKAANEALSEANARATKANTELVQANADLKTSKAAVLARYDLAVDAIQTFHTGVSEDFLLKEDQFKELHNRLLTSASDFYGKLGALLGKETDFASRRALAQSNFELAELTWKVGRLEDALAAHRSVLAVREALAAVPGAEGGVKADVGGSLTAIAYMLNYTAKTDEALATYRRSESVLAALEASEPAARAMLADCRTRMARLLSFVGKTGEALEACRLARVARESLAAAPGASDDVLRGLANTFNELGILFWLANKPAQAVPEYRKAIAIQQKLAKGNPSVAVYRQLLANSHAHLGMALARIGEQVDAEAETRLAMAIDQKLADEYPSVAAFRRNLARCKVELSDILLRTGRQAEAEAELRTMVAIIQKVVDENTAVNLFRGDLAFGHRNLGIVLLQTGRPAKAEFECRTATAMLEELLNENPTLIVFHHELILALNNLGDAARSLGKSAEARGVYERAIAKAMQIRKGPADAEPNYLLPFTLWRRGLTLLDVGDPAGAAADVRRALELCEGLTLQPGYEIETACSHAVLAGLAGQPGSGVSPSEGQEAAARAMDWLHKAAAIGYRNVNQLRIESALDPLRNRADFQLLMMDLAFPADPFAR
jgi:eukaryotic-like serine/threonine-protein kinase